MNPSSGIMPINMKYRDTINFEPVEDVVKLNESGNEENARQLVSSYVVSEAMGAKLTHKIATNLNLDNPGSPKGIQIVGNYGTGKSHLMSVIGALAENDGMHLEKCEDEAVDLAMDSFRGKYVVARLTIGTVYKDLRDIVLDSLQEQLRDMGVTFDVPSMSEVNENTTVMAKMMEAFEEKFPGKGLLMIVDELLDFLRMQNGQAQFAATNFLREVGEFCGQSNFRFIAGLQASLFSDVGLGVDPEMAKNLARVKDRFDSLEIERTDIRTVISRRMLPKSDEQKALVRSHLEQFTETFESLERDMDTFVDLWPVHPRFLEIFHKMLISEKRQVFKEVEGFIRDKLDEDVPEEYPGMLTYDVHWKSIAGKNELSTVQEVREVKNAMETIESRIEHAMEDWQKHIARKLVHTLAIHRFTTPNMRVKVGLTANDIRMDVFPWIPKLPKKDPSSSTEMIGRLLQEVQKACLGELLNEKDGQWFIDLDLTQNWYHLVEDYRSKLIDSQKDRFFFDVIRQVVLGNLTRETDVPNHQIFAHEVEWGDHGVTRPGWLFFGAPNQRPTAKPAKDYYVYVLPPWKPDKYEDQKRGDEIFINFRGKADKEFSKHLETYASARTLMGKHSHGRQALMAISDESFQSLVKWMDDRYADKTEVRWKGTSKKMTEWTEEAENGTTEERFHAVASHLLNPHFSTEYPTYPSFSVSSPITEEARVVMASSAVRAIASGRIDDTSRSILEGLDLVSGNDIDSTSSGFVQRIEKTLSSKKVGEVTNFEELFEKRNERYFSKHDKLEPEWVVVLLAALIHKGSAVITYPAIGTINVDRIEVIASRSGSKFWGFAHVSRPKGLDVVAMKAICKLLSIPTGKVSEEEARLKAVTTEIREKAETKVKDVLELQQWLATDPSLWSIPVVVGAEESRSELEAYKSFLDSLQAYDKPAKWANLKLTAEEVEDFESAKKLELDLRDRHKAKDRLERPVLLLSQCESMMHPSHDWTISLQATKDALQSLWSSPAPFPNNNVQNIASIVETSLDSYRKEYMRLHSQHRLDIKLDDRKKALLEDDRIATLRTVSSLDIFNEGTLFGILDDLAALRPCWRLEEKELKTNPACPHCGFSPGKPDPPNPVSSADLDDIDTKLSRMEEKWVQDMLSELEDSTFDRSILTTTELAPLEAFEKEKAFPTDSDALSRFVTSVEKLLSGLIRVVITNEQILGSIVGDGEALPPEELLSRVTDLTRQMTQGLDPKKVRIVVKDEEDDP